MLPGSSLCRGSAVQRDQPICLEKARADEAVAYVWAASRARSLVWFWPFKSRLVACRIFVAMSRIPLGLIQRARNVRLITKSINWTTGTCRFISYSISCMRSNVLDSRNSIFQLGGRTTPTNGELDIPINTAIWGDVRINFYRHTNERWKYCMFHTIPIYSVYLPRLPFNFCSWDANACDLEQPP